MIIKPATQVGNPIIRRKSKIISLNNRERTKTIVKNLIDSMRYHGLVGMAAPQIGINFRIFVTEIRKTKSRRSIALDPVRVFINPVIIKRSKALVPGYEGCGSVAHGGLFGSVKRAKSLTVKFENADGKKMKLHASDLLARIIQHETDHLNGIVFVDRLKDSKSIMSRVEYIKMVRKQ